MLKIAILTSVISSYREGFYDRLFSRKDVSVKVYCQSRVPGMNLKAIHSKYPSNVKLVNFISAKRGELVWQFLPWRELLGSYDVFFIEGNPRVMSNVIFGTCLKLSRRKRAPRSIQ